MYSPDPPLAPMATQNAASFPAPHSGNDPETPIMTTMPSPQPTFFQKYFTQPVLPRRTASQNPSNPKHRLSLLSIGSLLTLLIILIAIIAAVVAAVVTVAEHHRRAALAQLGTHTLILNATSPIRLAIAANFADPSIWLDNGTWYAYATNAAAGILNQSPSSSPAPQAANIQMATSPDFIHWTLTPPQHDPLPTLGAWTNPNAREQHNGLSNTWAPGLLQRSDGRFVMYYSSLTSLANPYPSHNAPHCVGAALSNSTSPSGPYTPSPSALFCPIDQGGAIDAEGFTDVDGTPYVVYKIDGNNIGHGGACGNTVAPLLPTPILLQAMSASGLEPLNSAAPITLLDRSPIDGPLIEAPKLIRSDEGVYFLFYSSGCTHDPSYTVRYATATDVKGPYTRQPDDAPLLKSGDWGLDAPGSVGVHQDASGKWFLAFHARVNVPGVGGVREMFTTEIKLVGSEVVLV